MRKALLVVLLMVVAVAANAQLNYFEPVESTGLPYTIIVKGAQINDVDMVEGDEIGLYDGETCVGAAVLTGVVSPSSALPVTAWQSAPDQGLEGFTPGNDIIVHLFRQSDWMVFEGSPTFETGGTYGDGALTRITNVVAGDIILDADINTEILPTEFEIANVWPNPFNATTSVSVTLPSSSDLRVEVFNIMGRSVAILHNGIASQGSHTYNWNAETIASGSYYVVMQADSKTADVQRISLVK